MKILALTDKKSGSKYHRLELPLKNLGDGFEVKFIEEKDLVDRENFKNIDIFYSHWIFSNLSAINTLRSTYGFKWIVDIDDTIVNREFENLMPAYANTLFSADFVTCTNTFLALEASQFNKNVFILPNYLPVGQGQFNLVNKEREGLLKIGVIGSYSHYEDWLELKQILNRLAKNSRIVENCEFILAYEDNFYYNSIKDIFLKKKNIKFRTIPTLPKEEYMSLYEQVDCVLQPLVKELKSFGRSGLKLIETSIKGIPVIGSSIYTQKEFNSLLVANTPLDYENAIVGLLDNYEDIREKTVKPNLEINNWEQRIDLTKNLLTTVINLQTTELPENLELYSIAYLNSQLTEYTRIDNNTKEKAYRFEYNPIINTINSCNKEYVGFLSWKFPYKTGLYKKLLVNNLTKDNYTEKDVVSLVPKNWETSREYLNFSYKQHPKLKDLLTKCLEYLGVKYTEDLEWYTYSNFFIMKTEYYKDYVNNWIVPLLDYMENTSFWYEVNVDANYESGLIKEKLKDYTNLEFYNYVTFILERLVLFYVNNKKLKI